MEYVIGDKFLTEGFDGGVVHGRGDLLYDLGWLWVDAVPEHADCALFIGVDEVNCVGCGGSEVVGFDVVFAGEEERAGGEVLL